MEQFKEKLKLDCIITGIVAFLLSAFTVISVLGETGNIPWLTPAAGDSHWQSRWRGFIAGASIGLLVFVIVALIRNIRALHSEKALKKLYIKSSDERTEQIMRCAQASAYQTLLWIGLAAVVISGYFSVTVCITLLIFLWVSALLGPIYKVYFSRKF